MGNIFEFDDVNNVLLSFWDGRVTEQALLESYAAGQRIAGSRPPFRSILDFSKVTSFDVPNETVLRMAKMPPPTDAGMLFVIVAPRDLIYGVSRMFSILSQQNRPQLQVTRSMDEAYKLLGITSPHFKPIKAE